MIIVVADKWTHLDTCFLLPNLQHVRPTEHSNSYTWLPPCLPACLLQLSKTLRLMCVQFVAILMTNNKLHTPAGGKTAWFLADESWFFCRFSLQMLEKCVYLRCTICLSVRQVHLLGQVHHSGAAEIAIPLGSESAMCQWLQTFRQQVPAFPG
jgi:hypothetical protein